MGVEHGERYLDSSSCVEVVVPTLLTGLQLRLLHPCHLSVAEDGLASRHLSLPAHAMHQVRLRRDDQA